MSEPGAVASPYLSCLTLIPAGPPEGSAASTLAHLSPREAPVQQASALPLLRSETSVASPPSQSESCLDIAPSYPLPIASLALSFFLLHSEHTTLVPACWDFFPQAPDFTAQGAQSFVGMATLQGVLLWPLATSEVPVTQNGTEGNCIDVFYQTYHPMKPFMWDIFKIKKNN